MILLSWTHPTLQPSSRRFSGLLSPYWQGIYLGLKLCLSGKIKKLLYLNRIYCSESHLHLHSLALRRLSCITWLVTNPQVDRYQIFGFCSCFVLSVASVALAFKPVVAILGLCFFFPVRAPNMGHLLSLLTTVDSLFHFWRSGKNTKRSTKWSTNVYLGIQNEAGQRLTEFCEENTLVIANTLFQQHKSWLYTWTSPDGQYQNQIDSVLCSQRWRSSIHPAKTRPGADCGSDHELLIAKFRLKLKKVGKTSRPFRYDL